MKKQQMTKKLCHAEYEIAASVFCCTDAFALQK